MNDILIPRKRRRSVLSLQLTAMIDIFSMIVIFLIKGTYFSSAEVSYPPGLELPASVSSENPEAAPQIVIGRDSVEVSLLSRSIPLARFRAAAPGAANPGIESLKQDLRSRLEKLPEQTRKQGLLLNVVADRDTPYQDVFDTVRVFRESGFETLLFVATGPGENR